MKTLALLIFKNTDRVDGIERGEGQMIFEQKHELDTDDSS